MEKLIEPQKQWDVNHPDELIEETKQLVFSLKLNYMAVAENLSKIYQAWTGTHDDWVKFYQDVLELHKSTVSKMLTVGPISIAKGWRNEAVSLEKLYRSLLRNKKNPELALAEAKTWPTSDYKAQAKEDCKNPEYGIYCKNCWSTKENHA